MEACIEVSETFEVGEILKIILALCHHEHDLPKVIDLYLKFIPKISENIHMLQANDIISLVNSSLENYINTDVRYYNESLVKNVITHFLRNEVHFKYVVLLLQCLNQVVSNC